MLPNNKVSKKSNVDPRQQRWWLNKWSFCALFLVAPNLNAADKMSGRSPKSAADSILRCLQAAEWPDSAAFFIAPDEFDDGEGLVGGESWI
jgi:hypothetical protein